jgi:dihydroorotate dehydrogenase (NAD+) catalytic subunit
MDSDVSFRIDLVPNHKRGMSLVSPIMLASGCGGYGALPFDPEMAGALGAIVTLPIGARTHRRASAGFIAVPSGVVLVDDPGCLSPGMLQADLERSRRAIRAPLIARLSYACADWPAIAHALAAVPEVIALECDLVSMAPDPTTAAIRELARTADVPILGRVSCTCRPSEVEGVCSAGVDVLVIGAPAGALAWSESAGRFLSGELHSVGLFGIGLSALNEFRSAVGRPVVLGCGVHSPRQVVEALLAGAAAVQLGPAVLADPRLPARAIAAVRQEMDDRGLSSISELIGREAA